VPLCSPSLQSQRHLTLAATYPEVRKKPTLLPRVNIVGVAEFGVERFLFDPCPLTYARLSTAKPKSKGGYVRRGPQAPRRADEGVLGDGGGSEGQWRWRRHPVQDRRPEWRTFEPRWKGWAEPETDQIGPPVLLRRDRDVRPRFTLNGSPLRLGSSIHLAIGPRQHARSRTAGMSSPAGFETCGMRRTRIIRAA
jgi:hypothetical protein